MKAPRAHSRPTLEPDPEVPALARAFLRLVAALAEEQAEQSPPNQPAPAVLRISATQDARHGQAD